MSWARSFPSLTLSICIFASPSMCAMSFSFLHPMKFITCNRNRIYYIRMEERTCSLYVCFSSNISVMWWRERFKEIEQKLILGRRKKRRKKPASTTPTRTSTVIQNRKRIQSFSIVSHAIRFSFVVAVAFNIRSNMKTSTLHIYDTNSWRYNKIQSDGFNKRKWRKKYKTEAERINPGKNKEKKMERISKQHFSMRKDDDFFYMINERLMRSVRLNWNWL